MNICKDKNRLSVIGLTLSAKRLCGMQLEIVRENIEEFNKHKINCFYKNY